MGYRFKCKKCGHELMVKWLKLGDLAKCHNCGAETPVPAGAEQIDGSLVDLPGPGGEKAEAAPPVPGRPGCRGCRYLEKSAGFADEGIGFCHRYPPGANGRYPSVTAADWCGERAAAE